MRSNIMVAVSLGLFFSCQLEASAVPSAIGKVNRWTIISKSNPKLKYTMTSVTASMATLVREAFTAWQNVSTAYVEFQEETVNPSSANIEVRLLSGLDNSYAAAQAYVNFSADGSLTSCEVQLLDNSGNSDAMRGIIIHEIGHCLGLRHSVVPNAVMSYRNSSYSLTPDDEYVVSLLYPMSNSDMPMGCASIENQSPPSSGSGDYRKVEFSLLALAVFLMWHSNKKRWRCGSRLQQS